MEELEWIPGAGSFLFAMQTGVKIWVGALKCQPCDDATSIVNKALGAGVIQPGLGDVPRRRWSFCRPRYICARASGMVVYAFDTSTNVRWRKDSTSHTEVGGEIPVHCTTKTHQ